MNDSDGIERPKLIGIFECEAIVDPALLAEMGVTSVAELPLGQIERPATHQEFTLTVQDLWSPPTNGHAGQNGTAEKPSTQPEPEQPG